MTEAEERQQFIEKFNPAWVYSKGYWRKFIKFVRVEKGLPHDAAWLADHKDLLDFMQTHPGGWEGGLVKLWHEWIESMGGWTKRPGPARRVGMIGGGGMVGRTIGYG